MFLLTSALFVTSSISLVQAWLLDLWYLDFIVLDLEFRPSLTAMVGRKDYILLTVSATPQLSPSLSSVD